MEKIIQIFILLPLLGFIMSLIIPRKHENLLSRTAFGFVGFNLFCLTVFVIYWLVNAQPNLNLNEILIYQTKGYEFLLDFILIKYLSYTYLWGPSLPSW